jgi:uncharacterized membrane protein
MSTPEPSDPSPSPSKPLYDQGYINAMIHFYRGELGRIMIWRQRLDTTTTWAITSTTTIFTVAFTVAQVPHIIFFFNLAIVTMMLWIEARRYRFYDAFRARVRMLEAHFLVPMVMQNATLLQGDWKKLVCEDLLLPAFKISIFEAVGRRLKRNYIFIYGIILVAWIAKIFLHSQYVTGKSRIENPADFYDAMAVGGFPSWLTALVFVVTFISVLGISAYISRRSSGEVGEFGAHRTLWRI